MKLPSNTLLLSWFILLSFVFQSGIGDSTQTQYEGEKLFDDVIQMVDSLNFPGVTPSKLKLSYQDRLSCLTAGQRQNLTNYVLKGCDDSIQNNQDIQGQEERNFAAAQCIFDKVLNYSTVNGKVNTTVLKMWGIDGANLSEDKKKIAKNHLDFCMFLDMDVPDLLSSRIISNNKLNRDIIGNEISQWINSDRTTLSMSTVREIKRYFDLTKSLICLTVSLLRNGCKSAI